ncbi:MAG: hypothetical protein P3W87_008580 [Gammaproteobacteria bacterium]|nr:hypothetical protein [Gammaproteobacteria bacterium]
MRTMMAGRWPSWRGAKLTIDYPPIQAALSLEDIYENTGLILPA